MAQIEVIYDGACPVCRSFVQRFKPRHGEPQIALIDARTAPDRVETLSARGLDVDQSIVGLVAWCFGSPRRAALAYPLFRASRRLLLFLLRRKPVRNRA